MKNFLTFLMLLMLCYSVTINAQHSLPFLDKENSIRSPGSEKMHYNNRELLPPWQNRDVFLSYFVKDWQSSKYRFDMKHQTPSYHAFPFSSKSQFSSTSSGVETAWVRYYGSGLYPSTDIATAIAVDAQSNVYVTGYSSSGTFGMDYFTAKYSASGSLLWTARYNGEGHGDNRANAIQVDASGNVYVTGGGIGAGTGWDYATVKYNSEGLELWVARYNGTANSEDEAIDLALDAAGNIYVTGRSWGADTWSDYATVKYDAQGVQQWVARYNGLGDSWETNGDGATALAVDASGNVYVTGTGDMSGTGSNYITIKYNSAGVEQWVAKYNGPVSCDEATALALDTSGNVYVTGMSGGIGTNWDYATVKYDAEGVEQWVARYNGQGNDYDAPNALAIDASGNVYVTGSSDGAGTFTDYATVKYNSAGVEQWIARYNGPDNSSDEATALALDGTGNVYVTGGSVSNSWSNYATVKYNSAGVQQWVARYDRPGNSDEKAIAMVLDTSGNIYVTGWSYCSVTFSDYVTVKYNADGAEQWVAPYNGLGNSDDHAVALAIDATGNIYVTGESRGSGTERDYATVRYSADGVEQWVARYNGPGNYDDWVTALSVDAAGNIYVTGISAGGGTWDDYATVKYDVNGNEQWVARYNGPGNKTDDATALAVDAAGNVYVTGESMVSYTSTDYATIKYNSEGNEQWVAHYSGQGNGNGATAIAVDASGNVYVTGWSVGTSTECDYATIKYNSAGEQQWVARYNGPGNGYDNATALAVDGAGNVYVSGSIWDLDMSFDYATIKYNSDGVQLWVAQHTSSVSSEYISTSLVADDSGNVYMLGDGFSTVKYNSEGVEQWVADFCPPLPPLVFFTPFAAHAKALALDAFNNIYVAGFSWSAGPKANCVTIKYNCAGEEQWFACYDGPGNTGADALAVDDIGNVYVAGTSSGDDWSVYTTIKYIQTSVSVKENPANIPTHSWLAQNYPNPFNPSTTIEFALPKSAFVTLKVYNLLGEEVATLVSEKQAAGIHRFNWDAGGLASGVYLYRLEAGTFIQAKKLILMR